MSNFYKHINESYGVDCTGVLKLYNNEMNSLRNSVASKVFLLKCRRSNIIPKHITSKTNNLIKGIRHSNLDQKSRKFIQKTNKFLLNAEIDAIFGKITHTNIRLKQLRTNMYSLIPQHIANNFIHRQKKVYRESLHIHITDQNRKYEKIRTTKEQNMRNKLKYDPGWFINLTPKQIPEEVHRILSLGPKFSVAKKKSEFPLFNVIADTENIIDQINDDTVKHTIRGKATTIITNCMRKSQNKTDLQLTLEKDYRTTKTFLRENSDIIIIQADKGNITIAMSETEYKEKMMNTINNTNAYKRITRDPTTSLQEQNNKLVAQLHKGKHITVGEKTKLTTYTALTPRSYGVLKVHKPEKPIRMIVSTQGGPAYALSKFLAKICKLENIENNLNIKNSYDLKSKIDQLKINNDEILVSFDVISLFDSIPLQLAYEAIKKRWTVISKNTSIPLNLFLRLTKFCIEDCSYFKFDTKFYKQKNGLAMGGGLSPIIADFVLTDILEEAKNDFGYDPKLFVKYVDDILMILPKDEVEETLTILNNKNENIKFTVEYEQDNFIPYLDMKIIRMKKTGEIVTDFYQKPSNKGRMLSYWSNHPNTQKIGVAYSTINRILTLSSKQFRRKNEFIIHNILLKNSYPKNIITKLINRWKRKNINEHNRNTGDIKYRSMTYVKNCTEPLGRLFKKQDPKIKLGYMVQNKVQDIYNKNKDPTPIDQKHGLIYRMNCKDCDKIYIGQTGQLLKNRMAGHKTNHKHKYNNTQATAALQHSIDTGHIFDYKNPKILATQKYLKKRLILETLYINKYKDKVVNLKSDIDSIHPEYSQLL